MDLMRAAVLPAAGAAAVVYFVASMLPLVRRASIPVALAIACGFVAGIWQDQPVEFRLNPSHRLHGSELLGSLQAAIIGSSFNGAPVPASRYWLPWIVAAGLLAHVVTRMAGTLGWW